MKLPTKLLAGSVMAMAASSVLAIESTTLVVSGKINTPACQVSVPTGTNVNFGEKRLDQLSETAATTWEPQMVNIEVNCPANTFVGIAFDDSQAGKPTGTLPFKFFNSNGSAFRSGFFSLGVTSAGTPIGGVAILASGLSVDGVVQPGVAEQAQSTLANGYLGLPTTGTFPLSGQSIAASSTTEEGGRKVLGKRFVFPLNMAVTTVKRSDLAGAAEDIKLDGKITVTTYAI